MSQKARRPDLIEPELSYKIVGILFEAQKELGHGHREKVYQGAVATLLAKNGVKFQREVYCPVMIQGISVGKYYLDFLIEGRIILELKRGPRYPSSTYQQIISYLQSTGVPLAILGHFGKDGVVFQRVLKPQEDVK